MKVKDLIKRLQELEKELGNVEVEMYMEEKYINKILNFSDENICTAKELVINREQAKKIVKELQEDYTPNAIIKLKIAELKKEYKKLEQTSDFIIADTIQPKIQVLNELLESEE